MMLTYVRSVTTNMIATRSRIPFHLLWLKTRKPIRYSLMQDNNNVDYCFSRWYSADENKPPPRRRRGNWNTSPTADDGTRSSSSSFQNNYVQSSKSSHILRPVAVMNAVDFEKASYALLDSLVRALRPMEDYNDFFQVCVTRNREKVEHEQQFLWELTINLKPGDGTYRLVVDREACNLVMSSPVSGSYTYVLCQGSGNWVGEDDGHSLIGLLVRDLGRQCNGYPNF
jgi:frataxin-like iron-binding protein CyaY